MDKSYIVADMNMSRPVGWTTEDEVDYAIKNTIEVIKKLAKISPFRKELSALEL